RDGRPCATRRSSRYYSSCFPLKSSAKYCAIRRRPTTFYGTTTFRLMSRTLHGHTISGRRREARTTLGAGAEKRRPPRWTLAVVARTAIGRYASGSDPPNLSKGFRRPLATRPEILRRNRAGRGASSAAGVPPGYRPDIARAPIWGAATTVPC